MKKVINNIKKMLKEIILDENRRLEFQYQFVCGILGTVSIFMSIVNIFTKEYRLLIATSIFAVACIVCLLLCIFIKKKAAQNISTAIFVISFVALFTFFIISGNPEGFSCIWIALLPTCGMILFKRKNGTFMSAIMFAILIFFFYTPFGRGLIQTDNGVFPYTDTFMLRFPMLYLAFYFVALFLEYLLEYTYNQYKHLYSHDGLTNMINRTGFNEIVDKELKNADYVSFAMFDMDDFKKINDTYGHLAGDEVIKQSAKKLNELIKFPVCRWGGEEFAVFMPNVIVTKERCDEIVKEFSKIEIPFDGKIIKVTISLGAVVMKKEENTEISTICNAADDLLYIAKENGKNQAVFKNYMNEELK